MNTIPTFENFLYERSGYVETMNPDDLQEAIEKIASVWSEWKNGPATKSSDIAPAKKELLAYIEKTLK